MDPEPQAAAPSEASLIHTFLATRDEPCPGCNYNLRGLTGETCPECEHTVRLCVAQKEPASLQNVVWCAAIGLVFVAGYSLYLLVTFLGSPPPTGVSSTMRVYLSAWIAIASIRFCVGIGGVVFGIMRRRRRKGAGARIILGSIVLLLFVDTLYSIAWELIR